VSSCGWYTKLTDDLLYRFDAMTTSYSTAKDHTHHAIDLRGFGAAARTWVASAHSGAKGERGTKEQRAFL
jgi:hypothetical protein